MENIFFTTKSKKKLFNILNKMEREQLEDLNRLKDLLLEFISEYKDYFLYNENLELSKFDDVIGNCDNIEYNDTEVYIYTMFHFLYRYRRFQIMQRELIKIGCFQDTIYPYINFNKEKKLQTRILDVGTGPAQALFAYSDYYQWYSNFFLPKKVVNLLADIDFNYNMNNKIIPEYYLNPLSINIDYVERSSSFRQFLHHFIEFSMIKNNEYLQSEKENIINLKEQIALENLKKQTILEKKWQLRRQKIARRKKQLEENKSNKKIKKILTQVEQKIKFKHYYIPFQHGTFSNITNYTEQSHYYDWSGELQHYRNKYDLVIMSNFLTNAKFVSKIHDNLQEICNSITHNGLLLIIGAAPTSQKYSQVHDIIKPLFTNKYRTKYYKQIRWIKIFNQLIEPSKDNRYLFNQKSNEIIKDYFLNIRKFLTDWKLDDKYVWDILSKNVQKFINDGAENGDKSSWHMMVYQKKSKKWKSKRTQHRKYTN